MPCCLEKAFKKQWMISLLTSMTESDESDAYGCRIGSSVGAFLFFKQKTRKMSKRRGRPTGRLRDAVTQSSLFLPLLVLLAFVSRLHACRAIISPTCYHLLSEALVAVTTIVRAMHWINSIIK